MKFLVLESLPIWWKWLHVFEFQSDIYKNLHKCLWMKKCILGQSAASKQCEVLDWSNQVDWNCCCKLIQINHYFVLNQWYIFCCHYRVKTWQEKTTDLTCHLSWQLLSGVFSFLQESNDYETSCSVDSYLEQMCNNSGVVHPWQLWWNVERRSERGRPRPPLKVYTLVNLSLGTL